MYTLTQLNGLSDAQLSDLLTAIAATISGGPTTFGLSAGNATAMTNAAENFGSALLDWNAAKAAADTAKLSKDTFRDESLATFRTYLNLMYATPTVSEISVSSLGLAPRSTERNPVVPEQPVDLVATPFADGTVKLTWGSGGNKYGVVYEVERAGTDATDWTTAFSTTKRSVTLPDAAPGVIQFFRVSATKNGLRSQPSFTEGIYLPAPGGFGEMMAA